MTTNTIPMILTGQALQSLRDSGYSLAAALGEPIDNSVEANANNIDVLLEDEKNHRGKKHIHRITIIDDGTGMDPAPGGTLHHYLQLGFSTRYMSQRTIGKYGVGAKLAALNFGRRIDVWSRTDADHDWAHVFFDLDEVLEQEGSSDVGIASPDYREVPHELQKHLPEGSGTVIVWSRVDRLEEGRRAENANALRIEVEKELSRMFRYFLEGGITIRVNSNKLLPHDPLFLMAGTWGEREIKNYLVKVEKQKPTEVESGSYKAKIFADEMFRVGTGEARLRVTLCPSEAIRPRRKGGDDFAKKLRLPENEGSISFVRLDREINYTNVPRIFPRGVEHADRYIGIEVSFTPDLDDYFGVRNVKRGVEPADDLRAEIRKLLERYVPLARKELDNIWGVESRKRKAHEGEHKAVVDQAAEINRTLPKGRSKGTGAEDERKQTLRDLAKDVGKVNKAEQEEYIEAIKDQPFVVESVDFPGTNFIDVQHLSDQVIIRVNTRHRFYREMWEPVRNVAEATPETIDPSSLARIARRTQQTLTLLLIAYGKAESMHPNPETQYADLRSFWGQFLDTLLGRVRETI